MYEAYIESKGWC